MSTPMLGKATQIHLMIDKYGIMVIGARTTSAEQAALRLERSINKGRFMSVYTLPYQREN